MCLNIETELDINMYIYIYGYKFKYYIYIYIYVYTEMCRDHTLLNFQAWHDSASSGGGSRIYSSPMGRRGHANWRGRDQRLGHRPSSPHRSLWQSAHKHHQAVGPRQNHLMFFHTWQERKRPYGTSILWHKLGGKNLNELHSKWPSCKMQTE